MPEAREALEKVTDFFSIEDFWQIYAGAFAATFAGFAGITLQPLIAPRLALVFFVMVVMTYLAFVSLAAKGILERPATRIVLALIVSFSLTVMWHWAFRGDIIPATYVGLFETTHGVVWMQGFFGAIALDVWQGLK